MITHLAFYVGWHPQGGTVIPTRKLGREVSAIGDLLARVADRKKG